MYRRGGKRLFDVVAATLILLPTLIVMAVVAVLVRLRLGSPVLFRQDRPGRDGRVFTLVKFRTMSGENESASDAERLSPFGAYLRSTSLDETPELLHVIKGDMSLVGPRPLLVTYLDQYTVEQARRHEVRPGITGWAQINGRNNVPWPERLAMDVWYVEHCSLRLDLVILWRTVWAVIKRADAVEEGQATATPFTGGSLL